MPNRMAMAEILFTRAGQTNFLIQKQPTTMLAVRIRGESPRSNGHRMVSHACETTDLSSLACRPYCASYGYDAGHGLREKVPARDCRSTDGTGWCIQSSRHLKIALHGSHCFPANKACKRF
mmetsp:Transcript_172/g.1296  ORF Transcript_172/g.1296 Transcript_172/m.1296 type:complete len:121 (-) Transcript_172:1179-1541(-)